MTLSCQDLDYNTIDPYTIGVPVSGTPDFTTMWTLSLSNCDATRTGGPFTALETAVYKASHYTDGDISTIYEICGCVDKDDVYAGATFVPSKEQVPEIQASLLLCPKHPKANAWRKSLSRAADRAALEKSGRTFASGVYLVGKQIKPGTYVVTGDIENCYWERQDRTGNIIQNNFVLAARRVEVTIRSSDYAFSSQGCGQWKPA